MGRMTENPRYNVISVRLNDEELAWLEQLVHKTQKTASMIMREAFSYMVQGEEKNTAAGGIGRG